ncbi:MAG TPA: hypothetical protein DHU55_12925 [Blastocatellia bacterium]|nr:hypothetical protein [Blastocatellia bacterium]HCX30651.1 hypothetical protein [Blastocatellia bacterium]
MKSSHSFCTQRHHFKISAWLALFFIGAFAFSSWVMAQTSSSKGQIVGTPWTGALAVQESSAAMMAREAHLRAMGWQKPVTLHPQLRAPQGLTDGTRSSVSTVQPAPGPAVAQSPAQTTSLSFLGAQFSDEFATPPDTMGAVGPTQFLVAVNGRFRVFNKTTGSVGSFDVDSDMFFASVLTPPPAGGQSFTSDPRVRYDRLSGRWFISMIDVTLTSSGSTQNNNRVLLAVSDTSTVSSSTVWSLFFFRQDLVAPAGDSNRFADYPTLGIDAQALYVGTNMFTSSFCGSTVFVIRKSSVLGAGPIVVTAFRDILALNSGGTIITAQGPYTPTGADNVDPHATVGFIIGTNIVSNPTTLFARQVNDPGGTPTLSGNINITVPTYATPITVNHLGNTGGSKGKLDGSDNRLFNAHFRNGHLWTAHCVGVDNTGTSPGTSKSRDGACWYDILMPAGTLNQSGTLYDPTGIASDTTRRNYTYASIMVSGQGHSVLGSTTAGSNEHANAFVTGRLATDAAGTLRVDGTPANSPTYTTSTTAYNPSFDTGSTFGRRWGDYSYTSLDPSDDMTMWTIQEWCNGLVPASGGKWAGTASYGVQVVKLLAPPPATPSSASPSSVASGQSSVLVAVTGTQVAGSGFYKAPTGITPAPRKITAFLGSGVTVNRVIFHSPTSVTLDLNTQAATPGTSYPIRIKNPDLQARTSASNLLTIVSP